MIQRRKPIARSTKPIARKAIKRRMTPRRQALLEATQGALDLYFEKHGWRDPHEINGVKIRCAKCLICGYLMTREKVGDMKADPCHKWRRQHNRHEPHEILAGHRRCHAWLDNKAHSEREKEAQASLANCQDGGIIAFSERVHAQLKYFLETGHDPLNWV